MSTKLTGYVWDGCAASGMKLSSVAIMARLADFSNDEGVCWPSIETIARQIGAGMSTVRTAIARLEAEGWLTRKARRQGNRNASNVYQLNVAKLQAAAFSQLSDSDPSKSDASKSDPSKFDASKSGKKAGFHPSESGGDPSVKSKHDPSDKKPSRPDASQPDTQTDEQDFLTRHPDAVVFSPKKRQWGTQDDLTCAQWFWKKIIALYEQAAECDGEVVRPKEPNWTAWANEIRLMCVQDGRTHKQICEMYSRVSRDPFWCRNVLSPSKLREKWDELSLRLSPSVSTHTEKCEDPYFKASYDNVDYSQIPAGLKKIWALANDMNCSAGQLLASAASRRLVTQTARTGSIGVMMAHSNYGAALEKQGVEITLIYSGSHKVDGNPYSHLPDDVRETLQSRMDATRRMFAQKVSAYTGLSVQAVLDTEAAVYSGQEPVLRLQQLDQQLLRLTARKLRRRVKLTQSPARRQRRPAKRMPKPAKLRRKTARLQQPKARARQLVLQARRLLLPLHQPTVKKRQKPVKPMQRQARLQRRTRRKHRQQARQQLKQVKTQPESMQVRQQSRINMSYSHCLMCGYRLTIHWI